MPLKIVLAQINLTVGAIADNSKKICQIAQQLANEADVIIFPELALTGYPPGDLLLRQSFIKESDAALQAICQAVPNVHLIIGHTHQTENGLFNAASVIYQGKIIATYHKQILPNYAVFIEKRYFVTDSTPCVVTIKNIRCGIVICEDIWFSEPALQAKQAGAEILLALNASPYDVDHPRKRLEVLQERIKETHLPFLYVNLICGQDELVFDGGSMALQANGEVVAKARHFEEELLMLEVSGTKSQELEISKAAIENAQHSSSFAKRSEGNLTSTKIHLMYQALVFGLREYIRKNNFKGALLGLSGGMDSALTLAIAVDAIGAENIHAVMMPSQYTADISLSGAEDEANTLGVQYSIIPIEPIYQAFLSSLKEEFEDLPQDITEENLQARCRGVLLMALSNKNGKILLNTSNKSELAVGYGTLYGDMAGGYAVLKDVLKTEVYELAAYRNTISPVIPEAVINRAPSAELSPNQTDQDSLPPYPILDAILKLHIEKNLDLQEITAKGFDEAIVRKVLKMVQRNEYKRQQAPPGTRVSSRAFGQDWQMPITNKAT